MSGYCKKCGYDHCLCEQVAADEAGRHSSLAVRTGSGLPKIVGFDVTDRTLTIQMPDPIIDQGYTLGAEILIGEPGWTVQASDYDKLAEAARWLRRACKDRLPPGHYDKVSEECRAVDALLCPNASDELTPAHSTTRKDTNGNDKH